MFGWSIPLGLPAWCDVDVSEELKDARTMLEIQQEADLRLIDSVWMRVCS